MKNSLLKRIMCICWALVLIVGLVPATAVKAFAATPVVDKIEIVKTYKDGFEAPDIFYLTLSGSGLDLASVEMQNSEGAFTKLYPTMQTYALVQYKIKPEDMSSVFYIAGTEYDINESDMPEIKELDPKLVKKGDNIEITGINFNNISSDPTNKITVKYTNGITHNDISSILKTATPGEIKRTVPVDLGLGLQDIRIDKAYVEDTTEIKLSYRYVNAFRIYDDIAIDEDDITIFPNKGKPGTKVSISTVKTFNEDYSVFFMKDIAEPFNFGNMGQNYFKSVDAKNITVTVPEGVETGETYKVVLTNKINYSGTDVDADLTSNVIKQKEIGEFIVVDARIAPQIQFVQPAEGPDSGSYVSIIGKYIEELNIEGLAAGGAGDLIFDSVIVRDEKLVLSYNCTDIDYNGKKVNSIERELLVTIGRNALFLDVDDNEFVDGGEGFDKLYVKTKAISREELEDPVKDVIIEITTKLNIGTAGENVVLTETAVKEKAYTFLASFVAPEIKRVSPQKIQVTGDDPYFTKEESVIAIQGENFKVYSYTDSTDPVNPVKVNYPKVILGLNGTTESDGEIFIKRKGSDNLVYDDKGNLIPGATMEVLDKFGNVVDGVAGNETGTIIILRIPKNLELAQGLIGVKSAVAIANPIKGSKNNGPIVSSNEEGTGISFVKAINSPEINSVKPNIVTVNGDEEIIVKGFNFQDGIKVFIDGKEVHSVVRDTDPITTEGTLKFTAPKGREGITVLQVINVDGGSDSSEFVYVKSINQDPKIESIGPNKGSKDTLVVIKGTNFFKPDLTIEEISGMGIYTLIGTRVLLDGKDVNIYNGNPEVPQRPVSYTVPTLTENLFSINDGKLKLSKYKQYATVFEDGHPENIYTLTISSSNSAVLARGEDRYNISVNDDGNYVCVKDGVEETITIVDNDITIGTLTLKAEFDYSLISIRTIESGRKKIGIADYYESIYLYDPRDRYLKIFVDDKGRVKIGNSNDTEYSIKIEDDKLVALKAGKIFDLIVNPDSIQIMDGATEELKLTYTTPYYFDENSIITGNRVKVKNKNEVWFIVPDLPIQKWYDVTVKNPDTKSDTKKNEEGFMFFKSPHSKPEIISVVPRQGTTKGGTPIVITGSQFQKTSSVYIGGVKVPDEDVKLSNNMKYLTVKVPEYPGNVEEEFVTDRKTVPIVIVNEDGGKAVKDDGFTYIIANSTPRINEIYPVEGSAAGGEIIDIFGYDFRFYEPYTGEIGEADFEYDDLDEDGNWDNMNSQNEVDSRYKKDFIHDKYNYYYDSPVLPKVYFGNKVAKIVAFNSATGYIQVIAPTNDKPETVEVYVINNDSGKSNSVSYVFKKSDPKIKNIMPEVGKKEGNEIVDIVGTGFKKSLIEVFNEDPTVEETDNLYLVRFADISNRDLEKDQPNSGRLINGRTTVELKGGLKASYELDIATGIVSLTVGIREADKEYKKTFIYEDETKYLDVTDLVSTDDSATKYVGYEYIKFEVEDGRLIVSRGYSKESFLKYTDQIQVRTPNYHTVGKVNVVVENPDCESNAVSYTYKNPISSPTITAITGVVFKEEGTTRIVQAPTTGGQPFYIEGTQFLQDNITVRIGGYPLKKDDFTWINENKILVKSHKMNDNLTPMNTYLIEVQNEDGARATTENINVYYRYITVDGDEPIITSIDPAKGSAAGGYTVCIRGKNFDENIKVIFGYSSTGGGAEIIEKSINRLIVKVPESDVLGQVDVYIENVDYSTSSVKEKAFEYVSNPKVNADAITPNEVFITGGQKVTIVGDQFLDGVKVYFGDYECPTVTLIDTHTIEVEAPKATKKDLGFKDVRIVNKDEGSTVVKNGIKFVLPKPSDPAGFEAIPGHERSVVLRWDETQGAQTYKIYGKTKSGGDYKYIGETTKLEYYLVNLDPNTKYYFRLWAVNEFDQSANYAYASCTTKKESADDADDKFQEEILQDTEITTGQNSINIQLPEIYNTESYIINLNDSMYDNSKELTISIPIKAITQGNGYVYVTKNDYKVYIPLINMKVNIMSYKYDGNDTNVKVNIKELDSKEKSRITKGITRKQKAASQCYDVKASIQIGKDNTQLKMYEGFTFSMLVNSANKKKEKLNIMSYNPATNKLIKEKYVISNVLEYINNEMLYNVNMTIKEDKKVIVIYNK